MSILSMQRLLMTTLFHTIHKKYCFMRRKILRISATRMQVMYIWRSAMSIFSEKNNHYFHQQVPTTNYIYVDLDESFTNVCQLHYSKLHFIKFHIDSLNIESFIIM